MDEIIDALIKHLKEKHSECEYLKSEIQIIEQELPYMDVCDGLNTVVCPYHACDFEIDFTAVTTFTIAEVKE